MKYLSIVFLTIFLASNAAASQRFAIATYGFTATGVALDVDLEAPHNIRVTQVHLNLSAAITVDEPVYIRRLSSTGTVLSVHRVDPVGSITSANFTISFSGFYVGSGDYVAIDWANTGALNVLAGSNITYERD